MVLQVLRRCCGSEVLWLHCIVKKVLDANRAVAKVGVLRLETGVRGQRAWGGVDCERGGAYVRGFSVITSAIGSHCVETGTSVLVYTWQCKAIFWPAWRDEG